MDAFVCIEVAPLYILTEFFSLCMDERNLSIVLMRNYPLALNYNITGECTAVNLFHCCTQNHSASCMLMV